MTAALLLDRLDKVRPAGTGRWTARCPAHPDQSPSLSIKELDDQRILVHCFAGCGGSDVMAAIGLTLADLYPDRLSDHLPREKDRVHWHAAKEALRSISNDALLVAIGAENIADGVALDDADRTLLVEAAARIREAREAVA